MSATSTKDKYVYGARGEASGEHEGCQQPIPKTNMYMVQGVKLAGTMKDEPNPVGSCHPESGTQVRTKEDVEKISGAGDEDPRMELGPSDKVETLAIFGCGPTSGPTRRGLFR